MTLRMETRVSGDVIGIAGICTTGVCTGRSDLQCVTQREGKSPVPFSKLETYPGGWGFYPLSILCLNPFGKDHSIRDDRIQSRGWPLASQIDSGVSKIW